jgi:hypothetical protein
VVGGGGGMDAPGVSWRFAEVLGRLTQLMGVRAP